MAIDSGKFKTTDMIDVVSPLVVGRFPISDYHPEKRPLNVAKDGRFIQQRVRPHC